MNAKAINIMTSGSSCKIWLTFNQRDTDKMRLIFQKKDKDNCNNCYAHKNIYVTLHFLRAHDINFKVVIQTPGIGIIAPSYAAHQVLSMGETVCIAWNLMPLQTNIWNYKYMDLETSNFDCNWCFNKNTIAKMFIKYYKSNNLYNSMMVKLSKYEISLNGLFCVLSIFI